LVKSILGKSRLGECTLRKGQAAFEYILVVGIAMLLIVPGALLFYNYSIKSGDELLRSKIDLLGNEVMDGVEKVYYIGESSWETVKVDVPDSVKWVYILNNSELVIEYESHAGVSQAVFFSDINITTPFSIGEKYYISDVPADPMNMHAGLNMIKITSKGHYVLINEVT
jgi:hypothetical protein